MSDAALSLSELQELERIFKESDFDLIEELYVDKEDVVPKVGQPCQPQQINCLNENKNRFGVVNEEEVLTFIQNQENANTKRKTVADMKLFQEFCKSQGECRHIELLAPTELDTLFGNYIAIVKKPNKSEYEPSTIRGFVSSLDRYLRGKRYPHSVNKNAQFPHTNNSVKAKMTYLKSLGYGSKPNESDELTDEDIDSLFECGQLGVETPTQLVNMLHLNFSLVLGMRGGVEQRNLKWGDIDLATDEDGDEYIVHRRERQTKTRTGKDPNNIRKFKPKVWAVKNKPERCPVNAYKIYRSQRPEDMNNPEAPFFLSINHRHTEKTLWFKSTPMGRNHIYGLVSKMRQNCSKIDKSRKITNHSVRKHLMQKCNDLGMPANVAIQISGHKNVGSANNYSKINERQQKQLSNAIIRANSDEMQDTCTASVSGKKPLPMYTSTCTVSGDVSTSSDNPSGFSYSQATNQSTNHSDLQSIFCGTTTVTGGTFNFYTGSDSSVTGKRKHNYEIESERSPRQYKRILPLCFSSDSE